MARIIIHNHIPARDAGVKTFGFDIPEGDLGKFHSAARAAGLPASTATMKGPGGGNPLVRVTGTSEEVHNFVKKHYDPGYSPEDTNRHIGI